MQTRFTHPRLTLADLVVGLALGWWLDRHSSASWRSSQTQLGTAIVNQKTGEGILLESNGAIGHFQPGEISWSKPAK
jgi:hypothetical protein